MDQQLAELDKVIKEREIRLIKAREKLAMFQNELFNLETEIDSIQQTLRTRYNAALAETNKQNKIKLAELQLTVENVKRAVDVLDSKVREAYLDYSFTRDGMRPREPQFNGQVTVVPQPRGGRKSKKNRKGRKSIRSRRR